MENEKNININIRGIYRVLTIIFVLAKIYGKIDWDWQTVFIPMYVEFGLAFLQALAKVLNDKAQAKLAEMKKTETVLEKALREAQEGKR